MHNMLGTIRDRTGFLLRGVEGFTSTLYLRVGGILHLLGAATTNRMGMITTNSMSVVIASGMVWPPTSLRVWSLLLIWVWLNMGGVICWSLLVCGRKYIILFPSTGSSSLLLQHDLLLHFLLLAYCSCYLSTVFSASISYFHAWNYANPLPALRIAAFSPYQVLF